MAMTQDPSDRLVNGLFSRARAGDQAAWEELFHQCYPKVIRAVRRRLTSAALRSQYDSTDFANDAWKSLVAKQGRFDFPTVDHLIAYLVKVARSKVIDEDRRMHSLKNDVGRNRPIAGGGDGAGPRDLPSRGPTASQVVIERETLENLRSGLGEVQRKIIDLRVEGHSSKEIAIQVGWHVRHVQRFLQTLPDPRLWPDT
jgi:RNA polymerase sigma factor (sigma-70 family)